MKENTENIIKKVEVFLSKAENIFSRKAERSDPMVLYHILHIIKALDASEQEIANLISKWLTVNKEKLEKRKIELTEKLSGEHEQGAFSRYITQIDKEINKILKPDAEIRPPSDTELDSYLDHIITRKH